MQQVEIRKEKYFLSYNMLTNKKITDKMSIVKRKFFFHFSIDKKEDKKIFINIIIKRYNYFKGEKDSNICNRS